MLKSQGFAQEDIEKNYLLSGGKIIKLLLAKMLMGRYNILLMDEPSNFLDILSLEALEILMKEYAERVNHIFEVLGLSLFECYDMTEKLYNEVKEIVSKINKFLNEENSDERKQI